MNAIVQNLVVGVVLAAAAGYVLWRIVRLVRGKGGACGGGCRSCAAAVPETQGKAFVAVDQLKPPST